jgi:hypothetical protein
MPSFFRRDYVHTAPEFLDYADRNSARLQIYAETGFEYDRVYYGVTSDPQALIGAFGVIVGNMGGFEHISQVQFHTSCVQRTKDPHRQVNVDIYKGFAVIHTLTLACQKELLPSAIRTVADYCDRQGLEQVFSRGVSAMLREV